MLKESKKAARDQYKITRDKYEDQQDDIRFYEWAKRI